MNCYVFCSNVNNVIRAKHKKVIIVSVSLRQKNYVDKHRCPFYYESEKLEMSLSLIPVVEVLFSGNKVVKANENAWQSLSEWTAFQQACAHLAGLEELIKPIEIGYSFYKTSELSLELLHYIVEKELAQVASANDMTINNLSSLYGGFVLQENGKTLLFPQTVGTLKNIEHWENIANGKGFERFWIGEPSPTVNQTEKDLLFEFEHPNPPFVKTKFTIEKAALKVAVATAKEELSIFENLINLLNFDVKVENLGRQLIYQ